MMIFMRILFVNHLKPTTASFLRQFGLGRELSNAGHKVSFMGRKPSNVKRYGRLSEVSSNETGSNQLKEVTHWAEPFEEMIPFNIAKLLEKSRDFDLIHVNKAYPFTSMLLSFPKFLAGKPVVVDWEDWDGIGGYINLAKKSLPSRFVLGFFEEVVPKRCDSIITVSKILAERAERKGIAPDRIFYVPNGFDQELFNEKISGKKVREILGLGSRPTVLLVSALHSYERENFTKIFDCMASVVKSVPDAVLLIAGQGDVEQIMKYAQSLGIGKNIIYLGYVPHEIIPQVIAATDVAIHILSDNIYFRSSSPMVVPEYMSMGKAVVASDVGELRMMLNDGAGILVKNQTPEAFGDALVSVLTNTDQRRRIEQTALLRAKENYSYRHLAKLAESAYRKAVE